MKYPGMTWGKMEAVINKLGGMEGVERFLSGELELRPPNPEKKIWKTRIFKRTSSYAGGFTPWLSYLQIDADEKTRRLISSFEGISEDLKLDLYKFTVSELGFPEGQHFERIILLAQTMGYKLCPPDAGLAVCLESYNKSITTLVVPVRWNPSGINGSFSISGTRDKFANVNYCEEKFDGEFYWPSCEFVFAKPHK